jgi:hypothetical protein
MKVGCMDFQMLHSYENSAKSLSTYIEDTLVIYYLFISHLPFICSFVVSEKIALIIFPYGSMLYYLLQRWPSKISDQQKKK